MSDTLRFLSIFFISCGIAKAVIAFVLYLKEKETDSNE